MDFLNQVNKTNVTPELSGEALRLHSGMPPERRNSYEARMFELFRFLDDKGLKRQKRELAMAIDFRLTALARLNGDKALSGWTLPGSEPGQDFIHENLLKAAALEPVVEDEYRQAAFNAESFQRRVLAFSKAEGNA
ncbi:hypothetical protein SAMN02927900_06489 [Rhizobium mongolense subsp. loessense]|uniref:Uncharacterized protein n=1 Tax=Rhizobium mongolense subsp. loessense TaxID=158890 RepID=A0A1G4UB00_9HYPH|nr:hypothetical protein [Rhizobium mongolense]SCW90754.1 hypothetical protein SAMN02927900_06489 [Rhizobium mongolense subsp. loessense]